MSGCFGNHPIDRWMESQLNRHLDEIDRDEAEIERAFEEAENKFGKRLLKTDKGFVFEHGFGDPYLERSYDEDGVCFDLKGVKEATVKKSRTRILVIIDDEWSVFSTKGKQ